MQCMSRRGSGDRRMKALRYFLAVYFIVAMSWLRSGLPVLAQVPVVGRTMSRHPHAACEFAAYAYARRHVSRRGAQR